jgi:hypothetical protein
MSCVQPLLSQRRHYGAAAILLMAVTLMVSAVQAYASCWAKNPTGQRKCSFFRSRAGNLDIWLCEDKQGDCASLGYTPLQPAAAEIATKAKPAPAKASLEASSTLPSLAKAIEPEHMIIDDTRAHLLSSASGRRSAPSTPPETPNDSAEAAPTSEPA